MQKFNELQEALNAIKKLVDEGYRCIEGVVVGEYSGRHVRQHGKGLNYTITRVNMSFLKDDDFQEVELYGERSAAGLIPLLEANEVKFNDTPR